MAKYSSRPVQKWTCLCGRTFRRSRKCLKCGDDLPWLVYRGEISFAERRQMTLAQYKTWRSNRIEETELAVNVEKARAVLQKWLAEA